MINNMTARKHRCVTSDPHRSGRGILPLIGVACVAIVLSVAANASAIEPQGADSADTAEVEYEYEYDYAADTEAGTLDEFRDELDPHGTWVDDPTYGTVWVPDRVAVGADFQPYRTAGRWAVTDDGDCASARRGSGEHAVSDCVGGAIEARRLSIPEADNAVVTRIWSRGRQLTPHDGGGRQLLVDARAMDDREIGIRPEHAGDFEIEATER